ncbi:putative mitochondrial protein [Vitis vinifera]|uniref:Putative mitochondrial protein n=1 Tax=Vitis vinifera TaxID=29760 RepID=A0A438E8G0_VITVI|nr:putative mitochondrial protein [Vitis vinifera]
MSSEEGIHTEDTGWKADIGSLQLDQISQEEAEILERPFTEDEIRGALMEMNGDKAPSPDGFTLAFLAKLLGKCGAEDLGDFRPISLLGGLYKLLAKVLANRLKIVVMQKMGFGSKWVGWMWSCLSSAKFLVMVNGVPAGFFPSSKGLRQGDPLSPYLFVMGMEVLDVLIRRAVEGGFLSGCNIRGGSEPPLNISHLFFADDTIIFCEARKDHLTHLSWILFWFEAASGLRINLAKSEIIAVGEVVEMEELAVELRMPRWLLEDLRKCKGTFVGRRKYGGKAHLVNWEVVCTDKAKGGLGIRKLALLNKHYLASGYGGKGNTIRFWTDVWCSETALSHCFPHLFGMAVQRNTTVEEMWDQNSDFEGSQILLGRIFNPVEKRKKWVIQGQGSVSLAGEI